MAQACISYSSLKDASSEANRVAKKINTYAGNLESQVYKKLSNYNGQYTTNISQAKSNVNAKISALKDRSKAYSTYAQDLIDLKDQCVSTDKAVKSNVSRLTADFKSANGIKDSKVKNTLNYFLTSIGNSSSAGRWLGNKKDELGSAKDYVKQRIEDWWDYEGGAEVVKGVAIGVLEGVLAVCAIVASVLSGGAILVIIAGAVAGAIALVNAGVNIANEIAAYKSTKNGDPATGQRRSDVDSLQDYLRSSFFYGDDGENYKYDSKWHMIATGIDIVNFVCTAITIIDGAGELIKKAYKWTTGSMADIKNLRVRDILTKDNFVAFKSKIGQTFSNGFADIKHALELGDFSLIKETAINFGDDFLNNLKKGYTFEAFAEDKKAKDFIKHGAKLVKNYSTITKSLVSDGFSISNVIGNIGLQTIILKNIDIAEIVTYKGGGGVLSYDIGSIQLTDITGKFGDIGKLISGVSDIYGKLSESSNISIQIPEISIPKISGINVVAA